MLIIISLIALTAGQSTGILPLGNFVADPGYTGPLNVSGRAVLAQNGDNVVISFSLSGVDPSCHTPKQTPYSCGIVLMSGFSCRQVGNAYFGTPQNPWENSSYIFDHQTNKSSGNVSVAYGHSIEETMGRVLVLYDSKGQRISCSQLPDLTDELNLGQLSRYPGYNGSLAPSGQVELNFRATSVQIAFILGGNTTPYSPPYSPRILTPHTHPHTHHHTHHPAQRKETKRDPNPRFDLRKELIYLRILGVDPLCVAKNSSIPNSCGIHIHEGTSCQNASSHYFNPTIFTKDPWATISYVSSASGNAGEIIDVEYGYGFDATRGRTFVLHDYTGARVSCVLIPDRSERTTATLAPLTPYPGYAGTLNITGSVKAEFGGDFLTFLDLVFCCFCFCRVFCLFFGVFVFCFCFCLVCFF